MTAVAPARIAFKHISCATGKRCACGGEIRTTITYRLSQAKTGGQTKSTMLRASTYCGKCGMLA